MLLLTLLLLTLLLLLLLLRSAHQISHRVFVALEPHQSRLAHHIPHNNAGVC
jgi:hypothetical protein